MIAAEEPAPLLTPAEHEAVVAQPQPTVTDEPLPPVGEPLCPPPSVGQVLSAPMPAAVPRTEVSAPAPAAPPREEPPVAAAPVTVTVPVPARRVSDVPAYALVSPVELHFTGGAGRIGVKPGTRSFVEFQRLAGILLQDLREARGW